MLAKTPERIPQGRRAETAGLVLVVSIAVVSAIALVAIVVGARGCI